MGTHLSAILDFEDPLDVRANLSSVASALKDCGWTEPGSWQAPPSEECTSLQEALAQLPDADELLERRPPVLEVSTPAARMDISVARARHIGHDAFGSITLDVHKVGRRFFTDPLDRDERADDLKEAIGALPWRDRKSRRAKQELAERESQLAEARGDLLWLLVTALSELPTLMSLGFYFDDLDPVPGAAALLWFRERGRAGEEDPGGPLRGTGAVAGPRAAPAAASTDAGARGAAGGARGAGGARCASADGDGASVWVPGVGTEPVSAGAGGVCGVRGAGAFLISQWVETTWEGSRAKAQRRKRRETGDGTRVKVPPQERSAHHLGSRPSGRRGRPRGEVEARRGVGPGCKP